MKTDSLIGPLASFVLIGFTLSATGTAVAPERLSPSTGQSFDATEPRVDPVDTPLPLAPQTDVVDVPDVAPDDSLNSLPAVVEQPQDLSLREPAEVPPSAFPDEASGRAYLIETARPGTTMVRQGAALAIGRLHPEFVMRLANAIWQAHRQGLPFAGIESAYRPPAYGVGGFIDKFKSLHTYGLAVDMAGIQGPGSAEAMLWHQIAARNGIICPYGPYNRAEWNHCQATRYKMILADNPLRATVTADGPVDLDEMFDMAASLIDSKDFAASYELEVATAKPPVVTPVITKAVVRPQADAPRRSRFGLLQKTYHLPRIATKTKLLAEEHHDQSKRARQAVALNREQARSQTRRDQHAKESKVTSRHRKA